MIEVAIDTAIAAILLILAGGAIFSRNLFGCTTLFITFGMALTLAWVRLCAVDLALAEAAIGAGLTGALLLNTLAQEAPGYLSHRRPVYHYLTSTAMLAFVLIFALALALLMAQAPWGMRPAAPDESLAEIVQQQLGASGVSHPVTAVLLNFRAWDTLLELLVLLLALLGIRQLRPMPALTFVSPWPLLLSWSKILAPLLVLAAGYLLWSGTSAPGGAFQAGAVLASGAIILRLNHLWPSMHWSYWQVRSLVLIGPGAFMGVAIATAWPDKGWLDYPVAYSGLLILFIEIAATITVAATLTLLVVGEEKEMHS